MEFNRETFRKALEANRIIKYERHFEAVVKSYLEIEKQQAQSMSNKEEIDYTPSVPTIPEFGSLEWIKCCEQLFGGKHNAQ